MNKLKQIGPFYCDYGKLLGKGSFGEVYEGTTQMNGANVKVAFKLISMQLVERKSAMKYLLQELQIMRDLSMYAHPNVVRLYVDHREADMHYLVLEHCPVDFANYLWNKPNHRLESEDLARYYLHQLITGLKFLNENQVIHRDLKPANLLLSDNSDGATLKICDFGLSGRSMDMMESFVGSYCYMAPEVLSQVPYSFKYDVWGCGLIFFEMLCGKNPYHMARSPDEIKKLQRTYAPVKMLEDFKPAVTVSVLGKHLLAGLMAYLPDRRFDWKTCLAHEYFKPNIMMLSLVSFPEHANEKQQQQLQAFTHVDNNPNQHQQQMQQSPGNGGNGNGYQLSPMRKPDGQATPTNTNQRVQQYQAHVNQFEVAPVKDVRVGRELRLVSLTGMFFGRHGYELGFSLKAGQPYTIERLKRLSNAESCVVFDGSFTHLKNDTVLFDANLERPPVTGNQKPINLDKLYFVDFNTQPTPYKFAAVPDLQVVLDPDNNTNVMVSGALDRVMRLKEALRTQRENLQAMMYNVKKIDGQLECAEKQMSTQKAIVTAVNVHQRTTIMERLATLEQRKTEMDKNAGHVHPPLAFVALVDHSNQNQVQGLKRLHAELDKYRSVKDTIDSKLQTLKQLLQSRDAMYPVMALPSSLTDTNPNRERSPEELIHEARVAAREVFKLIAAKSGFDAKSPDEATFEAQYNMLLSILSSVGSQSTEQQADFVLMNILRPRQEVMKLYNDLCTSYYTILRSLTTMVAPKERSCTAQCTILNSLGPIFNTVCDLGPDTDLAVYNADLWLQHYHRQQTLYEILSDPNRPKLSAHAGAMEPVGQHVSREIAERDAALSATSQNDHAVLPLPLNEVFPQQQHLAAASTRTNGKATLVQQEIIEITQNNEYLKGKLQELPSVHAIGSQLPANQLGSHTSRELVGLESQVPLIPTPLQNSGDQMTSLKRLQEENALLKSKNSHAPTPQLPLSLLLSPEASSSSDLQLLGRFQKYCERQLLAHGENVGIDIPRQHFHSHTLVALFGTVRDPQISIAKGEKEEVVFQHAWARFYLQRPWTAINWDDVGPKIAI